MKLSIITINLNHATGLEGTIRSVLDQTFRDHEFIVVDGGSTDGSLTVIRTHADRITRWVSEKDKGIYNAMNKGLALATGEYVCFMNSGDQFYAPDVLQTVFAGNQYPEDLLYGDVIRSDGPKGLRRVTQPDPLTVARFFTIGLCHQATLYKRELFSVLGNYDENLVLAGDWEFTIRVLLARRSTRHLPFILTRYEGAGLSVTQRERNEQEKQLILTRLLPEAIYPDYLRLRYLEAECGRLQQFEDWATQIRERNVLINFAMVSHWAWLKIKRLFSAREGSRP